MLKLKRYLKPYFVLLVAGIVLLFGQATLELTLPNLMSDIVNVGIQQGGITSAAPQAISSDAMQLMQLMMSEQERTVVQESYETLSERTDRDALTKQYPNADDTTFILREDADKASVEGAFSRASYAFIQVMQSLAEQTGTQTTAESDGASASIDFSQAGQLAGMLAMRSDNTIQDAIDTAAATPDMMTEQTAAVFVKSFYQDLGADTASLQTGYILTVGLKMLGLTVLLTACAISAGFCMARLGAGVGRDLRRDVFSRVTRFNQSEMDRFSTASLITRSTNDVQQIQMFLSMGFRLMCFAPIMGIGGLVMGLSKCPELAWVLLLALAIMLLVILTLFAVALPRFKKMQQFVDRLNLVSREELSGMMVVRAFSNQKFMQDRFESANHDLTSNTLFVNRAMAVMMPVMTLVMNGVSLLIVWFGGKQIAESNLQVGDMMAFIQYAMHVIMSFLFISMMFIMVPRASVSAERIYEVLSTENRVNDPKQPQHIKNTKGVVRFDNVSFRYDGADAEVLSHISFTARPGETTAFIGSTGSGKSTLVNLIPRFYDVSEGSVSIDGVDVRNLTLHELRDLIGYVPQKGMLFSGDISSNLRYGDKNATDETLHEAADVAQASEFISRLEDGYDTAISQGGTNVSGGQRQRLSIARALVKKAPIYIFDDTFSALDFKTDARLRKALGQYTTDATVLIVVQRVSTIMHAEQIVVLDEGHVVGIGTHEELLRTCDTYREIAESQLSKEELA